jgi:hypothetical protein
LIELMVWIWLIIGSGVTWIDAPPPSNSGFSAGVTYCRTDGTSTVYVRPGLPQQVSLHEMAHALDCADDGFLNSSPFVVPDNAGLPFFCSTCNTQVERFPSWVHSNPEKAMNALRLWAKNRLSVFGSGGGLRSGSID